MSLSVKFVPLVLSGDKTATWRCCNDKPFEPDRVIGLRHHNGRWFGIARIGNVAVTMFATMTDELAAGHETYPTPATKIATFQGYYGSKVGPDTEVTVVQYELQDRVIERPDSVTVIAGDDDWLWERATQGFPTPDFVFAGAENIKSVKSVVIGDHN